MYSKVFKESKTWFVQVLVVQSMVKKVIYSKGKSLSKCYIFTLYNGLSGVLIKYALFCINLVCIRWVCKL